MKMRDRVLSGLLALSLCAGLASPAALAADAPEETAHEPEVLAAKAGENGITLKFDPDAGEYGRVWLDVASNDVVVDSFEYTITGGSDHYEIDEYGYVVLKDGAEAADEELSISAAVNYFSGDAVVFADNVIDTTKLFETKTSGNFTNKDYNYDYDISSTSQVTGGQVARTGQYGITCAFDDSNEGNLNLGAPGKDLGQAEQNVTLTAWYYDPMEADKVFYASASGTKYPDDTCDTEFGLHIDIETSANSPNRYFMGIAATANNVDCNDYYYVRKTDKTAASGHGTWAKIDSAPRSECWHKMQWIITESGLTMTWDGKEAYKDSHLTSLQYIHIANNKGGNESTRDMLQDRHFIDDISVVKNDAAATAATLTTTAEITVSEPKPVEIDAVLLGTEDGVLASASDTVRVRLDTTGKNVVVDGITYSIVDADKAKVTLDESTGEIKWAEGYTPAADETVTVTVNYTYYSGNSVKYVENFDDASAKPFSNTNYQINDGQSRTGQYGVTPHGTTGDPATKAVGPYQEVRVTAWYYDPNTAAEQSQTHTMKYGFAATHDTGTVNTNQLGVFFGSGAGDGTKTHYAYRTGTSGNFVATSLERSAGWHKLEWVVTEENGTVMSIDGQQVAAEASRKQVANLTLATNWCGQTSTDQAGMELLRGHHYIDDISVVALNAQSQSGTATVEVTLTAPEAPKQPALTYGQGKEDEALRKGESGRVYLDNMEDIVIAEVTYTTDNENVLVDQSGILTVKDGYAPKADETVTVTATVTYYNKDDEVIFSDSFEGEKQFGTPVSYTHSTANPLFGRHAATATTTVGPSDITFGSSVTDVTVVAWYYDDYADHSAGDQVKFGFGILGSGENTMGIFYDGTIAPYVDNITRDHYGMRVAGTTYSNYSWGGSDVERSQGWHKLEWIIDSTNGMTAKIDGKVVSTNQGTISSGTVNTTLGPVENNAGVKAVTGLRIADNWNNNSTNTGYIIDRHFIDGVTVVKTGASTATMTLTSAEIPVLDIAYDHTPKDPTVDSTYPKDLTFDVEPDLNELDEIQLDGTALAATQWHVTTKADAPKNASYYPTGRLVIDSSAFKGLTDGSHKLTLVMTSGSTHDIAFTAAANTHMATDYYLSNSGSDSNDGHSAAQAWASFAKLSTVTFGPGDHIYLDATSVWSGVQFQPKGSGAEGKPIIITSYNNGGDSSRRPILNGDGTVANKDTANGGHSYLAFEPWRKFYPSGTIELFNVEYWEVRGIEITNYAAAYTQEGTGRNGIAVIHDFFETQGIETLPSGNQALEEAFYRAGKLQHIVVEDCYIHDVTGYHPGSGASGAGGKMSGGINVYGPYDGLKLDNNIIMYCDVEGIRNDVLAWRGDTRTQFPCYMEDISISNNFIVGVPGDGVVISSCIEPKLAHNYLTDAGYSYLVPNAGTVASGTAPKAMGNRQDPIIVNNSTNFAGLWFIGTMDAVAEYNESVNNVWTCNDGEAFDADMYTWGTVFQYNYTYRNNGGLCLFMSGNQMDDGTVVRYNVSVEDGEGVGTPNDGRKATFHYNKEPDAIYNNLFILGENVRGMFGGDSCTAYFYNNIVVKPSGEVGSFNLNTTSNSDAAAKAMTSKTVMNNNLFYPAAILDNVTGSFTRQDNITPDSLDGIFVDLDGFMEAQPVKALKGRSDLTGAAVNMTQDKGAGVAMSVEAGRSVTTPDGTGFDYAQFEGIKTLEGSPTVGAGVPVTLTIWPQTDDVHPLTMDFFRNDITGMTIPDIGPYQWSADANHYVKLTLDGNGSDEQVAPLYAKVGGTVTLTEPVKTGSTFQGWYESEDFSGDPVGSTYTVSGSGVTLYAKWEKDPDSNTFDVIFDTQGGSYVAPLNGLASGSKVTKPATDPAKEGYRFRGWYKDAEGTTAWDFDVDTVTVDTVIYAKWQALYYTVTFDSNGGDTQANPGTMRLTLPASSLGDLPTPPVRAGYVFLGWNTAADGSGTAFTGSTRISGNMTVYAQWRLLGNYIVTFNSNGGSAVAPESVPEGESVSKPADPTWSGYTFEGWYTDADCTDGSEYDFTTPVTADMTLHAKWTQNSGPDPSESPDPSGSPDPSEVPNVPAIQNPTPSKPGDDTTTTVEKNDDGSTTTTVTDNKTGTVTETTEKEDGTVEVVETKTDGTITETTKNTDGSTEVVETKPDGTVTETTTDPEGGTVEKVTAADNAVTITATDPEGEELAKVEIPAELPALETKFVDVPAGHWAEEGINEIAALGVVKGVGNDRFNMTDGIKRGDLATILFRLSNGKEGYSLQFSDVPADEYYADGIAWAARTGVVTGLSADIYAPEATVTREQLATMLYRYAKLLGLDANVSGDALDGFVDKDGVHGWAGDGMAWCVANGIIKGKGNDTLVPGAEASRAEVAVMLTRFIGLMK